MRSSRFPGHRLGVSRVCAIVLVLLTVMVPTPTAPGAAPARAAPTVSAAPVAVAAPPASTASARPVASTGPVAAGPRPGARVGTAPSAQWTWPVGPSHELQRSFQAPATSYGAGHRGIDIVVGTGAPVHAPADGVVSFTGVVVDRPVLSIQHAGDLVSSFEPVTASVAAGDPVSAGQVVGVVGTGAHCSGHCLHVGVRRHGQYISPMLFLGGVDRAVLLPLGPAG
ncbi:M23 family metallopeptidase [Cryobacterium sp.]|uniref:M23 family metallopeptidase n=1 Tax=Cryobacterium sp. TaxID=1926290 RepID=UPI00262F670D|nr:M23 family metallopeptidase [Cryobacterium sp.]MCU1445876.1 peptidase [Cryobacterium sp.]